MTLAVAAPQRVVLDASFVLRFVLHTQSAQPHPEGLKLLQNADLLVPALWNTEVANALAQAERRGLATPAKVGLALTAISALNPSVDAHVVDVNRILEIARAYGLSAYDAVYFELALRRKAAIATYDDAMIQAAPSAGIRLYPPAVLVGQPSQAGKPNKATKAPKVTNASPKKK
jgi:predicted nucleic acid-binding protein